jgi:hypothetical protein
MVMMPQEAKAPMVFARIYRLSLRMAAVGAVVRVKDVLLGEQHAATVEDLPQNQKGRVHHLRRSQVRLCYV